LDVYFSIAYFSITVSGDLKYFLIFPKTLLLNLNLFLTVTIKWARTILKNKI